MTSSFDWNQFESVPNSPAFAWESFEEVSKPSKLPGMKRELGRTAKVIGSEIGGAAGDIAQFAMSAPRKLIEKITGKQIPEEYIQAARAAMPFGQLPTSQEIKGEIEKAAPNLVPQTIGEQESEEMLGLLSSLLIPSPGGKAKAAQKVTDPRTLEKLYQAGKEMGLSPKQLTPLFQHPKKVAVLGKLGKMTPELKKSFELTESSLSDIYQGVNKKARNLPRLSEKAEENLLDKFTSIKVDLEKTLAPSPDKQAAIHYVEKAIDRLTTQGTNPEELLNFYKDINASINWNAIKGGKKIRAALKEPVREAIRSSDPKLSKEFENANALWQRMKDVEKQIGFPKIEKYLTLGKWASPLIGIALGKTGIVTGISTPIAYEALSAISNRLLTDPNWQNLHRRAIHAIKNNSPSIGLKTFQAIKDRTKKEMPEEYDQIDWSQF